MLYFRNGVKPYLRNMTNWDSVAAVSGDDTDDWPGHCIELYPATTELKGKGCRLASASVQRGRSERKRVGLEVPPKNDDGDLDDGTVRSEGAP